MTIFYMDTTSPLMPTVASLRAHTLTGVVQYEIERMIMSGELAAGERVNEKVVSDKLLVSRGPVREACRALAELGLIELIPNRGAFIKRFTKADAIEVYDLRAGLTALAGSLLASHLSAETLANLERMVEEMEIFAQRGDFEGFYLLNQAFHEAIVKATANSRLIKLYNGLIKEFYLFRRHGLKQSISLTQSNREHREIVAALRARDAENSYDASFRHVANGKQRMLLALDELAQQAAPERGGGT